MRGCPRSPLRCVASSPPARHRGPSVATSSPVWSTPAASGTREALLCAPRAPPSPAPSCGCGARSSVESRLSPIEPDRFGRTRYAVRTAGNGAIQAAEELRFARTARTPAERAGYLRGAFQGAGSVNRPGGRGGHHLEFVHREASSSDAAPHFSRAPLKVVRRRGRWVAYTKSADGVTTVARPDGPQRRGPRVRGQGRSR